jgi:hypothetical protein
VGQRNEDKIAPEKWEVNPHRVGRKTALKSGVEYTVGKKMGGKGFTVHAGAAISHTLK